MFSSWIVHRTLVIHSDCTLDLDGANSNGGETSCFHLNGHIHVLGFHPQTSKFNIFNFICMSNASWDLLCQWHLSSFWHWETNQNIVLIMIKTRFADFGQYTCINVHCIFDFWTIAVGNLFHYLVLYPTIPQVWAGVGLSTDQCISGWTCRVCFLHAQNTSREHMDMPDGSFEFRTSHHINNPNIYHIHSWSSYPGHFPVIILQ